MPHKPHAIHISNKEMKLEEQQIELIKDYQRHVMFGDKNLAEETLAKAHQVNAEYAKERSNNEEIAKRLVWTNIERDLFIQNQLS